MFRPSHNPFVSAKSDLTAALRECSGALIGIHIFSGLLNLLTLTGPIFMRQVYDRVVPSKSIATLLGLGLITAVLYGALGFFDQLRAGVLIRVGAYVDEMIHPKVFKAVVTMPLRTALPGDGLQPLRDLDQIRNFISGGGPAAFSDLPFLPIQIIICFLIHPFIGWATVFGASVIFVLTLSTDLSVRRLTREVSQKSSQRLAVLEAGRR